jgi:hypothetical protein
MKKCATNDVFKNMNMKWFYFLLIFLLASENFAMNISNEDFSQKIKPLSTMPPKGMFWTQGEEGCAVLKKKPSINHVLLLNVQSVKKSSIGSLISQTSTLDSSFEKEEDEMLNKFLVMPKSQQKETWREVVSQEAYKKYHLKIEEIEKNALNEKIEAIKSLLSKGVDSFIIQSSYKVSEEFVNSLKE